MKKGIFLFFIILTAILNPFCNYDFTIAPWEDGVVPYYLSGEFKEEDIYNLETAMERWESVCGVKFQTVMPDAGAYEIVYDTQRGWYSTIGENNSECFMHFNAVDNEIDAVTHELGHCLGFLHEHQRPDRDYYIDIIWENILPAKKFNFEIMDNPLITEQEFPYDYNSIMHYPGDSFSVNGGDTIIAKDGSEIYSDGISSIDAQKARAVYGPPFEEYDFE